MDSHTSQTVTSSTSSLNLSSQRPPAPTAPTGAGAGAGVGGAPGTTTGSGNVTEEEDGMGHMNRQVDRYTGRRERELGSKKEWGREGRREILGCFCGGWGGTVGEYCFDFLLVE